VLACVFAATPAAGAEDPAAACAAGVALHPEAAVRAAQLSAVARARLDAGDREGARACARAAEAADPDSATVALDAGVVALAAGDLEAAEVALTRARARGASGPELHEARALLAARRGDDAGVRASGAAAGTREGRLLAAAAGDGTSATELGGGLADGRRSAWSSAALALHARHWHRPDALRAALAQTVAAAEAARMYELLVAARRARARAAAARFGPVERAHGRVVGGAHTNPAWVSSPANAQLGAFTQLEAGVGVVGQLGRVTMRARVDALQRLFLTERGALGAFDLSGLGGAVSVSLPIGLDPHAARLDIDARLTGAWIERLARPVGSLLEVGPALTFRVAPQTRLRLAFYGVRYDFDSGLAPSEGGAPGNERDHVGQRAALGVEWAGHRARVRLDAVFTAEQAETPAFDSLGGGFGGDVRLWATDRLWTQLAASAWVRDFGPAVRPGPVGDASTRTEVRTRFGVELGYRLADAWSLLLRNDFVATFSREGSDYDANVLQLGVEVAW
jgi:hypothetical protein